MTLEDTKKYIQASIEEEERKLKNLDYFSEGPISGLNFDDTLKRMSKIRECVSKIKAYQDCLYFMDLKD